MIIGFAGKKQSGKNTACNYILSLKLMELGIAKSSHLGLDGNVLVSDILGESIPGNKFFSFNEFVDVEKLFNNELSQHIRIYSFAEKLKEVCCDLFGLTDKQCNGTEENKNEYVNLNWQDMPGVISNKKIFDSTSEYNVYYHKRGKMTARSFIQFFGTEICRKISQDIWVDYLINKITKEKPEIALISDVRFPNEREAIKLNNGVVIKLTRNQTDHSSHESERYDLQHDYIINNEDMNIPMQNKAIYETLYPLGILPKLRFKF